MTFFESLLDKHDPAWDGHINASGLAIIKRYEGWRSSPYLCAANRPTIGWGSTWDIDGNPVTWTTLTLMRSKAQLCSEKKSRTLRKELDALSKRS
jgi:GH24 family phage-related lysozyme (muramidase)